MTAQYSVIDGLPTGLSPTAKLFAFSTPDTEVTGNSFAIAEGANAKGRYVVTITRASVLPAGDYTLRLFLGSVPLAVADRRFAGTDGETATEIPEAVELDSATIEAINEPVLEAIAGIEGGGGGLTGPFTRTITVTDADTEQPIEGAKVRLYRTGETGTDTTSTDGIASFTVEAATWAYAITASGYTGVSGTIVVGANGNTAVEMTASIAAPPDNPSLCTVMIPIYDQFGVPLPDEPVDLIFVKFAANASAKPPVVSPPPPQTSDSNGQVIVELWRLATYRVEYGSEGYRRRIDINVPDSGTFVVQ